MSSRSATVAALRRAAAAPPTTVELLEQDELELEKERLRGERDVVLRQARELGIPHKIALRAHAAQLPLEALADVEFYAENPIFTTSPKVDDPLRRIIDLKLMSAPQLLEWCKRQAVRAITIPRDANDDRLDPTGEKDYWQHYGYQGIIWPVLKGEPFEVPWMIAEDWITNHSLRERFSQFRDRPAAGEPTAL